jgi:hypothetical protein
MKKADGKSEISSPSNASWTVSDCGHNGNITTCDDRFCPNRRTLRLVLNRFSWVNAWRSTMRFKADSRGTHIAILVASSSCGV